MDDLEYFYYDDQNYDRNTNRLKYVKDNIGSVYATDFDDMEASGNIYEYDAIGNLSKDLSEDIEGIDWTVSGKVKRVRRTATSIKSDLLFAYDASGNRIMKLEKPRGGGSMNSEDHWKYSWYQRDAQGNVMAVYTKYYEHPADLGLQPKSFIK